MILAAAIKIGDVVCHIPAPARHHHVLRSLMKSFASRTDHGYKSETQGFMTDKGEFLNREDAFRHAFDCGQGTPRRDALKSSGATVYTGNELFSEDLW